MRTVSTNPSHARSVGSWRLASVALLSLVALAVLPAAASAHIYWSSKTKTVARANLDGSAPNVNFIFSSDIFQSHGEIAIDTGHLYWVNTLNTVPPSTGTIGRANLDGSGVNQNFITMASGNDHPGIAVDSGHIYWANNQANTIGRANLNGTGVDDSFITGASGPRKITVDAGHIYWANTSTGAIGRANLNGSGANQSFISTATTALWGIAVDAGHVYWTNFQNNTIGRANLDGSDPVEGFMTVPSGSNPSGIAVDAGHIYWGNFSKDTIGRAELDGSDPNPSFVTGAPSVDGVAVGQPKAASSPGALTFGAPTAVPQGTVSAPRPVTYSNEGTGPLIVRGFAVSGADPNDFFTANDTCHAPVEPGDSCTAQVRFAPQAEGLRLATLTAQTNGPVDPTTGLAGTAGPLPTGPQGPKGEPGRDAKVTCTVKKKGKTKVKVTCTVKLLSSTSSARVSWHLTRNRRTVAHGVAHARHGRVKLAISRIEKLHKGRYVLHIAGRNGGTAFVVR
jgi:virginiamycin B lyase